MHKCLFRHSRRFVKAARRGTIFATGFILLPEYYTSLTFLVAACAACAVGTACSPARCEFYKCIMSACCADLRFICQHIFTCYEVTSCQAVFMRSPQPSPFFSFNAGYRGRASDLTVPGLGHSVIRGLVTNRSMVRREFCRLLA